MTAGINTKDVVDGNEKMILNILRCLEAFARRTKTRRQSIGGVASAKVRRTITCWLKNLNICFVCFSCLRRL